MTEKIDFSGSQLSRFTKRHCMEAHMNELNEQSDYLNSSMIKTFIAISVNQTISVLIAKAEKIIYDCLW